MLVLVATVMAAVLSTAFLAAQGTSIGIAGNVRDHAAARHVAESGLDVAIAHVRQNTTWRTDRTNGTWATDVALGGGTFTIVGEDGQDTTGDGIITVPTEGDGSLSDDATDAVTLTVTGKVNGVTHVVRSVVTPKGSGGGGTGGGLASSDASFLGEAADDKAGKGVAIVGDVNNDGYADIAIGAEKNDAGGTDAGKVYLFFGKASGWSTGTSVSAADASYVGTAGDKLGKSIAGAGDVNGDGYDDILVGAEKDDTAGADAGKVYVILGKASGWSTNVSIDTADASFVGEAAGDKAGKTVAGVGDVNNDGYDDFVVAAKDAEFDPGTKTGLSYLILGKASGWSTNVSLSTADASYGGEKAGDKSGGSVAGAGDVNGDGYADFLIGAEKQDTNGKDAGKVYLILGKASGWATGVSLAAADASYNGEAAGDKAGKSVAGVGDVNGDGKADFVVGAEKQATGGVDAGKAYVIFGKASGWTTNASLATANASYFGENTKDKAGKSVAKAGDVNGDGFGDFLVGAPDNADAGTKAGKTYLIYGKSSGWSANVSLANADASYTGENTNDKSGDSLAGGGDVDGNGTGDFLISAPDSSAAANKAGEVHLVLGTGGYTVVWTVTP
ncbi:MAG: hypothetical protein ACE5E6_09210 [Phycisphaerae bacterium]